MKAKETQSMGTGWYTICNSESGFALVTVLLLLSLLAVIGVTLNRTGGLQTAISFNLKGGDEAYYIANAGFQHGLFVFRNDPNQRGTIFSDNPFGSGSYTVSITDDTSPMGSVLISSTGKTVNALKVVEKRIFPQTITVSPPLLKDTYLSRWRTNRNYGISSDIRIGFTDTSGWGSFPDNTKRALFEYDLSMIPNGAVIELAVFELYMFDRDRDGGSNNVLDINVHRITRTWIEGTRDGEECRTGATWDEYNCSRSWDTRGGEFNSYVYTTTTVSYSDLDQWHQWDITNLVQYWIDSPSQRYGMILKAGNESTSNDNAFLGYFYSDEYSNANYRPKLTVTYRE